MNHFFLLNNQFTVQMELFKRKILHEPTQFCAWLAKLQNQIHSKVFQLIVLNTILYTQFGMHSNVLFNCLGNEFGSLNIFFQTFPSRS